MFERLNRLGLSYFIRLHVDLVLTACGLPSELVTLPAGCAGVCHPWEGSVSAPALPLAGAAVP
eukprot:2465559-Alexandrium_andersonii.AAC.1